MITVPINLNKIGCDYLIESFRTDIAALSWISNTFPAVKVGTREGKNYPELYQNNGTTESLIVQPDNSEKAFIFFEKQSGRAFKDDTTKENYSLSLICWYNLRAIDATKNYDFVEDLISDILEILRTYLVGEMVINYNYYFEDYSFINRERLQMVMYPFGAFKIDFTCRAIC